MTSCHQVLYLICFIMCVFYVLGIKAHNCPKCKKSFDTTSHLREHVLTHSSDLSYCCNLCGAQFFAPQYLRKHKQRHDSKNFN